MNEFENSAETSVPTTETRARRRRRRHGAAAQAAAVVEVTSAEPMAEPMAVAPPEPEVVETVAVEEAKESAFQLFARVCREIGYTPKGIFFSELYLFVQACHHRFVDLVVESGVMHGVSTRVLARCYPYHLIAVDRAFSIDAPSSAAFCEGDATVVIPKLIAERPGARIGILLDGPKGASARALKDRCFEFPQVKLVAIHDEPMGGGETFHSHDPAFRDAYGRELDALIEGAYATKYPNGPGLAVWVRN
jgi:hypothetical protein